MLLVGCWSLLYIWCASCDVVVRCLRFAVGSLLFAVCRVLCSFGVAVRCFGALLSVVCCVLIACCLSLVMRRSLLVVCCLLLFADCCVLCVVRCSLCPAC